MLFLVGFLSCQHGISQDYFGSEFTGQGTYGIFAKYDGKIGIGVAVNQKIFSGPFSRPLDFNLNLSITPFNKEESRINYNFSVYQLYANGNDFKTSFGLGAGLGVRGEYCPMYWKKNESSSCNSLAVSARLFPGVYASNWAVCARVEQRVKQFYFGCFHDDSSPLKIQTPILGLHYDQFKNRVHYNADVILDLDANSALGAEKKRDDWSIIPLWNKDQDCGSESRLLTTAGLNYRF